MEVDLPAGWLTVQGASELIKPDTSWSKSPKPCPTDWVHLDIPKNPDAKEKE